MILSGLCTIPLIAYWSTVEQPHSFFPFPLYLGVGDVSTKMLWQHFPNCVLWNVLRMLTNVGGWEGGRKGTSSIVKNSGLKRKLDQWPLKIPRILWLFKLRASIQTFLNLCVLRTSLQSSVNHSPLFCFH